MKKLYFIAMLGVVVSASAAPVTPAQALARLEAVGQRKVAPSASRFQFIEQTDYSELYFFTSGEGFIILPADDTAPSLLAYADSGRLDLSNPNLAFWLSTYDREIAALRASSVTPRGMMRISRSAIAPLTSTRWNQGSPYNDLCPEINGTHCVTGCVATALAQVLKFHNYPEQGTGSHSYTWNNETLSFNYDSTTFDWDNMTDTYDSSSSSDAITAVATLMYACGVGVDMSYTASESGAVSRDMGTALISYFGYDKGVQMLQRDYYGLDDWEELVYAELNEGRPVLYGGQGSAGGHQFICDGYSADGYFHFNWGWGGLSDGYFLLTALDPPSLGIGGGAGGFNYNQCIMIGVQPPTTSNAEAYLFYCGGFDVSVTSATLGSDVKFGNGFYNYGYFAAPSGTRIGIKLEPSDGSDPTYLSTAFSAIQPYYGISELTVNFPTNLSEGTYTITPVYQVPDHDWEFMRSPLSANSSLTAVVSGSTITFSAPDAAKITVSDLKLETDLYWGTTCKISFSVTNSGNSEFYDGLIPVLISSDGNSLVAQGSAYPVDVLAGASEQAEYVGSFSADSVPEAGTYLLGIVNPSGQLVCTPIQVQLNAEPTSTTIEVSNLKMLSDNPFDGQGSASFSFTAECTEGYFANSLTVAIFHDTGGSSIASGTTDIVYLSAGQSASLSADVDLEDLSSGRYMAVVFHDTSQLSQPIYFNVDTTLNIFEVDALGRNASVFDLMGHPVGSPRHNVLYIINGKKVIL